MKKLENLKGAKVLSKNEQQVLNGGGPGGTYCNFNNPCPKGYDCYYGVCLLSPPGVEVD